MRLALVAQAFAVELLDNSVDLAKMTHLNVLGFYCASIYTTLYFRALIVTSAFYSSLSKAV